MIFLGRQSPSKGVFDARNGKVAFYQQGREIFGPTQPFDIPEISCFPGIVIAMCNHDRAPPRFHALHGEYEVTVDISTGEVNGSFPNRALAHVREWRTLHLGALTDIRNLARARKPLTKIDPLE